MSSHDWEDDHELSNLPEEAVEPHQEYSPIEIADHWLEGASPDDQRIAIEGWFLVRFCDPAHETPYNGREGGYLFTRGGPYDPDVELRKRFSGIVDDDRIQEVVDELHGQHGDRWAPIDYAPREDEWEYDNRYGLELAASTDPFLRLRERLRHLKLILELRGAPVATSLAEKLVFGAAIGALESYLWETAHYWVENDQATLHAMVKNIQALGDQPLKLRDIVEKHAGLKQHVLGYLQNLVWHRFDKVAPLFRDGLGVKLPSVKAFEDAIVKRHDIVHRSGHDTNGMPISVSRNEIDELCDSIENFALKVDIDLASKPKSQSAPPP